jgi:hypothetical protein
MRVTSTRNRTASDPGKANRAKPYPASVPSTRLPTVVPAAITRLLVRYSKNGMLVRTRR